MIKVIELFGGIGAPRKALERSEIDFEVVDYVEIDKFAVKSYNAIYNENYEPQDICKWDKDIECDLIFHGSPCQSFSVAGNNEGGDEGSNTRSSLMWETIRIVDKLRPKYVIWENVKNVLSKKHIHNFNKYIDKLNDMEYNSYYKVLNAKDYGIPQNRERIFTVSIRKDIDNGDFVFPEKEELHLLLKDILEHKVAEKYYLKKEQIKNFIIKIKNFFVNNNGNCNPSEKDMVNNEDISPTITTNKGEEPKINMLGLLDIKGNECIRRVYSEEGISPTLTNMQGGNRQPKILIKNATKKGYLEAEEGDSVNLSYPESKTRRGRVGHQVSQTLQCNDMMGVVVNERKQ